MAEMIPDRMPSKASAGEDRVFNLLKQLPDDCIVYYEPVAGHRYPDFLVIIPAVGLLVIEVKGWYPTHIIRADTNDVEVRSQGQRQPQTDKHPARQAREYMFNLMDVARKHPSTDALIQRNGPHQGKFSFPFGHMAILSNITRENLAKIPHGEAVFPSPKVVTRDELAAFAGLSATSFINALKARFDPWWNFTPLNDEQISIIRAIIHPEIVIAKPNENVGQKNSSVQSGPDLKVLDLRQERNARSIGDGHRIVYGVAGSGKTILLVSRARLLAENPSKQILILCYNKRLAEYFRNVFYELPNVTALHFHAWGGRNGMRFNIDTDDDEYGQDLLHRLEYGTVDSGRFDAVFIDEAQDFARTWLMCAKSVLKEPDDGDLLIVGDGSQSLYKRRPFTWADAGINAKGRTINKRFDLDKNYRNTREILQVAAQFALANATVKKEDVALQSMDVDLETAFRHGVKPAMMPARNRDDECNTALSLIIDWLNQGLPTLSDERSAIAPAEIALLYPRIQKTEQATMRDFLGRLQQYAPVFWANDPGRSDNPGNAVTVSTIHASKGLQYKAVIIIWTDLLPMAGDEDQMLKDSGLLYVGLTRAEDILVLTRSGTSIFTDKIEAVLT
ncbi:MAG: NERD domain-containing protein/DEAD/DEAH box helicase [Pseudomonadota bacterium]